ncbi:TonB-dependent receptor [Ideonella sp. 4Y16]|uniref:TonB-dependent receptor n=1 Tax=Ideonella alba TaxID=2824118 RepID=UPI001B3795B4|nr:TonB-dependent receptor [Ideonella alba]MBQ0942846.1 TonB-dependent receptor [Ideonella alba]
MKKPQRTALSLAAAQVALMWTGLASAQQAPAPAPAASAATAIVVTGQRAALQSAQKIKQESDEIVDSIVADDIGKLPDRSITEVLQRVVGVTMDRTMAKGDPEHYSVEGSGVSIRGLSWVRSELNGRDSFSANGGRALNFEDVPPELMAGVDVYKNPSAEQIEGAVGGLVNLRTALPLDFKGFKGAVSLENTYNKLNSKQSPSGSLLLSNRWDTDLGQFGALLNLAHSESRTRSDFFQVEPYYPRTDAYAGQDPATTVWIPKGAQWRTLEFERQRDGLYGALQWKKNDFETALTYFQSKYHMQWDEQAIFAQQNPYSVTVTNGQFNDKGALVYGTLTTTDNGGLFNFNNDTRFATRDSKTEEFAWKAKWKASDRWSFSTDLQYIRARTDGFDSTVATGVGMPKETLDLRGATPTLIFDAADRAHLADPKNYYWAFTMEHLDRSKATEKAGRADAKYTFDDPVLQDLRFGIRLNDREALSYRNPSNYHWQALTQPWTAGGPAYLSDYPGNTHLQQFGNFFGGSVSAPPAVIFPNSSLAQGFPASYQTLYGYTRDHCKKQLGANNPTCDGWPFVFSPESISEDANSPGTNVLQERSQAAYAQLRFGFDDWKYPVDGNIGVRLVNTKVTAHGYVAFDGSKNSPTDSGVTVPVIAAYNKPVDFENTYTNVLPSLNLRMKAGSDLQFRFALAKAMSRPDFTDMQAYTKLSQDVQRNGTVVTSVTQTGEALGNPMLKPIRSTQADLTAEWYFSKAGSFTVALFDKELKDVIIRQSTAFQIPDTSGNPQTFVVTSPVNGAKGYARGFELAFQTYFDSLPGWMSGFGVQANYTYVDSKTKLYNPVNAAYCSGGNSATNFNLNLNGCDTDGRSFGDLPLQNLSRNAFSLALMYDQGPLSARLAYSWRGKYLQAVNVNGTQGGDGTDTNPNSPTVGQRNVAWGLPVWADAYGQVDGGVFYKLLNDQLTLGLEAQNLTSARQRQLMQQHIGYMTRGLFYTGPRYTVTARYTF